MRPPLEILSSTPSSFTTQQLQSTCCHPIRHEVLQSSLPHRRHHSYPCVGRSIHVRRLSNRVLYRRGSMLFSSRFYIWNCGCPCRASSDRGVQFSAWNVFRRLCNAPPHSNALIKVSLPCPPSKHTGHRHSTYTSQEARTFSAARFERKPNRGVEPQSLLLFRCIVYYCILKC